MFEGKSPFSDQSGSPSPSSEGDPSPSPGEVDKIPDKDREHLKEVPVLPKVPAGTDTSPARHPAEEKAPAEADTSGAKRENDPAGVPTPRLIYRKMDLEMVGNEQLKRTIAVVAHRHEKIIGRQFSVAALRKIIERHFDIIKPDSPEFRNILLSLTRIVRTHELNQRRNNPLWNDVKLALRIAEEQKLIRPNEATRKALKRKPTQAKKMTKKKAAQKKKTGRKAQTEPKPLKVNPEERKTQRFVRAVCDTNKRLGEEPLKIEKDNLVIIGGTGSGKTMAARLLSDILDKPLLRIDANDFTEEGYEGRSVSQIPKMLLENAGDDAEYASQSILFIDEIDKRRSQEVVGKDVSGSGVQSALLTLMEDRVDQETGVDFSTVLILFGGSFSGLEEIVLKRTGKAETMGFQRKNTELTEAERMAMLTEVEPVDLEQYGMMKEFVGRSQIVCTDPIDAEKLRMILTLPRHSPLRQKQDILGIDGIEFSLTEDAIDEVVTRALQKKIGARALKPILDDLTLDLEFESPDLKSDGPSRVVLNRSDVERALKR